MTSLFFSYKVGRLEVRFEQGNFDRINIELRLFGDTTTVREANKAEDGFVTVGLKTDEKAFQKVECHFSTVFSPFSNFILWLEAVALGVQECAFEWEAEGPDGRMQWKRRDWDTGHFTLEWSNLDPPPRIMLGRYQMVEAFYTAFRNMANSFTYSDPVDAGSGVNLRQLRSTAVENWLADAKNIPSGNKEITGEVH